MQNPMYIELIHRVFDHKGTALSQLAADFSSIKIEGINGFTAFRRSTKKEHKAPRDADNPLETLIHGLFERNSCQRHFNHFLYIPNKQQAIAMSRATLAKHETEAADEAGFVVEPPDGVVELAG